MSYTQVKHIVLGADAGSEIGDVMREAASLALKEGYDVVFEFNGKRYCVDPLDILAYLFNQNDK